MKKLIVLALGACVMMSSCYTNTATGAYVGGQFGHVIGSAIGGISGGWRGHDVGSLIGTVGGVAVGAAVGSAIDNAQERKYEERRAQRQTPRRTEDGVYIGGYDDRLQDGVGDNDDRIAFSEQSPELEIRHAEVREFQKDGVLTRGEQCTVSFEIMNNSDHTIYDVLPMVEDVTGNKHVQISPNLRIESIPARQGVRYKASILADNRLKDGQICVLIGVAVGQGNAPVQTRRITVPTAKSAR